MNTFSPLFALFTIVLLSVACSSNPVKEPTDYSNPDNWSKCESSGTKPVDTFFITGTVIFESQGTDDGTVYLNDELREAFDAIYYKAAVLFSDSTNMYVPCYREMDMESSQAVTEAGGIVAYADALHTSRAYLDITAALDYYFGKYNNGKPFIIAGASQGSGILRSVLSDYMYQHPEYYKRMVAAYGPGFGFPESYFNTYSRLKKATGETDTGVVISWNTEAPGATMTNALVEEDNCLCINPLNWKIDDTYAPETDNKGSRIDGEIIEHFGDAQINLNRHTVITNADLEPANPETGFGDKSLHNYEYGLFFENLKENIAKRIAAFLA